MEAHEVAIAALNEFANNSSQLETRNNATPVPRSVYEAQTTAVATRIPETTTNDAISHEPQGSYASSSALQVSSNDSQSTNTDINDRASTPPTSDTYSTQSHESQLSQLSQLAAAQPHLESAGLLAQQGLGMLATTAQKRTSSGLIKSHKVGAPSDPKVSHGKGHSRSTSAISTSSSAASSRIGEVRGFHCLCCDAMCLACDKHLRSMLEGLVCGTTRK